MIVIVACFSRFIMRKPCLLERLVDERLDAIVEVLPGIHTVATNQVLRAYHFQPVWHIPWLYIPVQPFVRRLSDTIVVQPVGRSDLSQLAEVLIAAYGYDGEEARAWQAFAEYGYAAPGYTAWLATIDMQPAAAGILHMYQESALVDGAATLPAYRGRGLQKALLIARILYAKAHGCMHAFSRTSAGSISQTNLHAIGMRLLTQSTAWRRI
jgi:GNAT superfamily N-acetyltransferase